MNRDCFASLAMTDLWIPAFAGMTHNLSRICHATLKGDKD